MDGTHDIAPPVHTVINVMLLSKPIIIVQTYKFFGYIVVDFTVVLLQVLL